MRRDVSVVFYEIREITYRSSWNRTDVWCRNCDGFVLELTLKLTKIFRKHFPFLDEFQKTSEEGDPARIIVYVRNYVEIKNKNETTTYDHVLRPGKFKDLAYNLATL